MQIDAATMSLNDAIDYYNDTTHRALTAAAADGWMLCKYADPTEDAREGLTVEEAVAVVAEDPSLIYLTR